MQITSSCFGVWRGPPRQTTSLALKGNHDWPVKTKFLGLVETTVRLGIKAQFGAKSCHFQLVVSSLTRLYPTQSTTLTSPDISIFQPLFFSAFESVNFIDSRVLKLKHTLEVISSNSFLEISCKGSSSLAHTWKRIGKISRLSRMKMFGDNYIEKQILCGTAAGKHTHRSLEWQCDNGRAWALKSGDLQVWPLGCWASLSSSYLKPFSYL